MGISNIALVRIPVYLFIPDEWACRTVLQGRHVDKTVVGIKGTIIAKESRA